MAAGKTEGPPAPLPEACSKAPDLRERASVNGSVPEVGVQVVVPLRLIHPLSVYQGLFGPSATMCLLESTLRSRTQGRYSFLAGSPIVTLSARGASSAQDLDRLVVERAGVEARRSGDALEEARRLLDQLRPLPGALPPEVPFLGGAIGYFGYELLASREKLEFKAPEPGAPPDLHLAFVDEVLAVDHETDRAFLAVIARADTEARAEWRAELRIFELMHQIRRVERDLALRSEPPATAAPVRLRSEEDESSYAQKVEAARAHIRAGDAFEVCLTRRIRSEQTALPARVLYERLCEESPAPFSAFLRFPDLEIVSASPERFLRLDVDGRVQSRPIKGTRPRGASPERDLELRNELATSEKDRAENLMIVDLVRNDLGRVAEIGSVEVTDLLRIEAYRTVHQLVSTVEAQLRPGLDVFDLLGATFPGGSMTGAPKIEAMKIISALERSRRGVYSGALGYIDHRGNADLAMVIRTAVKAQGAFELGVGGAVLYDSDPAAEWQESEDKAVALERAFQRPGEPATKVVGGVG